jgi:hypothetical protein
MGVMGLGAFCGKRRCRSGSQPACHPLPNHGSRSASHATYGECEEGCFLTAEAPIYACMHPRPRPSSRDSSRHGMRFPAFMRVHPHRARLAAYLYRTAAP